MKKDFVVTDGAGVHIPIVIDIDMAACYAEEGAYSSIGEVSVAGGKPVFCDGYEHGMDISEGELCDAIDWSSNLEVSLAEASGGVDMISFIPELVARSGNELKICDVILWTAIDYVRETENKSP